MIDPTKPHLGGNPVAPWRPRFEVSADDPDEAPRVSILTAFHRPGGIFRETVESVLRQTLQAWEWIVVDDASDEPEAEAQLAALEDADPRIRVIRLERNQGRCAARNRALAEARAELVFSLDQDDLLEATALEKLALVLGTRPDACFACGWSVAFGARRLLWDRGFERGAAFLDENQVSGRTLLRREALQALGGWDESLREGFEDWDLWLRFASQGQWGLTVPEVLDWFRRKDPPAPWEAPERREAARQSLRARHPELTPASFPVLGPERLWEPRPRWTPPGANRLAPRERRLLVLQTRFGSDGTAGLLAQATELLARQGWQVTAVAARDDARGGASRVARATPDVHVLEHLVPDDRMPHLVDYLLASRRPQALLCDHGAFSAALLPALRPRHPDLAITCLCHVDAGDPVERGGAPLLAPVVRAADRIAVTTPEPGPVLSALGIEPDRILSLPVGVDCQTHAPRETPRGWLRELWGARPEQPVVLCCGHLGPGVRADLAVAALEELARRQVDFLAVVCGSGPGRLVFERARERPGLGERLRVEDRLDPDRELKAMAAADCFLLPTHEGLAEMGLRALASGLPWAGLAGSGLEARLGEGAPAVPFVARPAAGAAAGLADALETWCRDADARRAASRQARRAALFQLGHEHTNAALLALLDRDPGPAQPPDAPAQAPGLEEAGTGLLPVLAALRAADRALLLQRDQAESLAEAAALRRFRDELLQHRGWLESQLAGWKDVATERERALAALEKWAAELRAAQAWHEEQARGWQERAEGAEARLQATREEARVAAEQVRSARAALDAERDARAGERTARDRERASWTAERERGRARSEALASRLEELAGIAGAAGAGWSPLRLRRALRELARALEGAGTTDPAGSTDGGEDAP